MSYLEKSRKYYTLATVATLPVEVNTKERFSVALVFCLWSCSSFPSCPDTNLSLYVRGRSIETRWLHVENLHLMSVYRYDIIRDCNEQVPERFPSVLRGHNIVLFPILCFTILTFIVS